LAGRWFEVAEAQLPEAAAVPHYLRKLCRQIARVALLAAGAVLALCLWMPETGRVHVLLHLVMPMLGPVVSVLTAVFYFGRRRQEDGFEGPGPQ
jgi:cytosine/uracil/thiamine/allantoin permease